MDLIIVLRVSMTPASRDLNTLMEEGITTTEGRLFDIRIMARKNVSENMCSYRPIQTFSIKICFMDLASFIHLPVG